MKLKLHLIIALVLSASFLNAQISFSDDSGILNNSGLRGGVAMAITDVNNDLLDDIIRLDDTSDLEIEFQQEDGSFELLALGNANLSWALVVADVDGNGMKDILTGGAYNGLSLFTANETATNFTQSSLSGPSIFLQNANFVDIDNDGAIDFFGCHDEGLSTPYSNDGLGSFTHNADLINTASTVSSDNSGNYGSIWTDYDLDGDIDLFISKCRQGVDDPDDGRRLNLLFRNDGGGNFTEVAPQSGLQPKTQTWASGFEDLDNDGDYDVVMVNHYDNHQLFQNNGDGTFTDITASTGIETILNDVGFGIQVILEDFDNDTYVDILMTTINGNHHLFLNNGDMTFTDLENPFPTANTIQSAAAGDLDNDGFIDIIAGFAEGFNNPSSNTDKLFINEGNDHNWTKIALTSSESAAHGLGARVEITGVWGTQTREIRAGESYGIQNSLIAHFGLGTATSIDAITITWPSGVVDVIENPAINTTLSFTEGFNPLSLEDVASSSFKLYPNPTEYDVRIIGINQPQQVRLYSVLGEELYNQTVVENGTIDTSFLKPGIYFMQIGDQVQKLMKK